MFRAKLLIVSIFLGLTISSMAQETYIIEGDTLQLNREVKGSLSLFWSQEENQYRYFVQKGNKLIELRNNGVNGETKKEYQLQLKDLTRDAGMHTGDVKFLLYSLKHFTNRYNARVQEDYEYNAASANVRQRVGLFTGLSNNRYTTNPENVLSPVLGLEYELYDPNLARRHSAFVHLRQSFKREDYSYSSTQLSLNYRFKLLYFNGFDVHIDTELATLYYSEEDVYLTNDAGEIIEVREENGLDFTAPLSFGVGADFRTSEHGFITFSYNDVVSIVLDGNGSFPVDFSIGYKYSL